MQNTSPPRVMQTVGLFQNSLAARIARGELMMEDILKDKFSILSLKRGNRILTDYVVDNITSLLTIILSKEDQIFRNAAVKAVQTGNKLIIKAISESSYLQEYTQEITDEKNVEFLAILTESCLSSYPELIRSSFKYLPQLANYLHISTVEFMYESLLSSDEKYLPVHLFLKFVEFPKYIVNLAKEADNEKLIRLLKLLLNCLQNKSMMNCTSCPESIELIKNCINSTDNEIRKYAYKFIYQAVIIDDNDEEFATLFADSAVYAFSNFHNYYYEYQVTALKFLCTLIQIRPATTLLLDSDVIIQAICDIFEKFCSHSFALSAIFEFIDHTISDSHFKKFIFAKFIPKITNAIENPKSSTQHSFAMKFLHDLGVLASRDTILEKELTPEIKSVISQYCEPFDEMIRSFSPARCGELYDDIMDIAEIPFGITRTICDSQELI